MTHAEAAPSATLQSIAPAKLKSRRLIAACAVCIHLCIGSVYA